MWATLLLAARSTLINSVSDTVYQKASHTGSTLRASPKPRQKNTQWNTLRFHLWVPKCPQSTNSTVLSKSAHVILNYTPLITKSTLIIQTKLSHNWKKNPFNTPQGKTDRICSLIYPNKFFFFFNQWLIYSIDIPWKEVEIRNLICLDCIRSLIFMWNCLNSEVAKMTLRCYNQHIKYSYGNAEIGEGREKQEEKQWGTERGESGEGSQLMPVELNAVSGCRYDMSTWHTVPSVGLFNEAAALSLTWPVFTGHRSSLTVPCALVSLAWGRWGNPVFLSTLSLSAVS